MSLKELPEATDVERIGVEKYLRNNNFFRTEFTNGEYESLPRRTFASFANAQDYNHYHCLLPKVVFIDLGDIRRFLLTEKVPGLSVVDVMKVAGITATFIGDDVTLTDVLWSSFEEEIACNIMAELGIEYYDPLMSDPFNTSIGVVFEISAIIRRYLVNARYPIVEGESVYGPAEYKNGLVVMMLKEYSALATDYNRREDVYPDY